MTIDRVLRDRRFINCRITVAIALFLAVNLIFAFLLPKTKSTLTLDEIKASTNEKEGKGSWIWWITRNFLVDGQNADIVFMGSSQMGSALYSAEAAYLKESVDTVTYRRSRVAESAIATRFGGENSGSYLPNTSTTFNMAFGGAMISDQFMLAKALFNEDHKPRLVVIGLNPRDFMDNSFPAVSSTDAFTYLHPYVDLGALTNVSFPDPFSWLSSKTNEIPLKRIEAQLASTLPLIEDHVLGLCPGGKSAAKNAEPGTSDQEAGTSEQDALKAIYGNNQDVRPGKWKVVAATWGAFQDNTREYVMRYKNPAPDIYPVEKQYFEELMAHLKKERIKVLVVGMPSLWPNRALLKDKFWKEFKTSVAATTTRYGGTWLDLFEDERFSNKDYLDTVHLNPSGGFKLVQAIVDAVAAHQELASCLQKQMAKAPPKVAPDYWQ